MSAARDLTRWRWAALGLLVGALILLVVSLTQASTIPTWAATILTVLSAISTFFAGRNARAGNAGPYHAPMILSALAALATAVAVILGGGESAWGWVAVALLVAAAIANFLPTRPAGRPLLQGQSPR